MTGEEPFFKFSKRDQLLHIASELERAQYWQKQSDRKNFLGNVERARHLVRLLAGDPKWNDNDLVPEILKEMIDKVYRGEESTENVLKVF